MPIFEYHCQDCGSDFEKLVRRADDKISCPTCGDKSEGHLEQRYSTFAPRANGVKAEAAPRTGGCPAGMCATPGLCGRN